MALLGAAVMLLFYDIAAAQAAEHDEWHTREHIPERVSIPGFIRAQRWVAADGQPHYMVIYEVSDIDVLSGAAYTERLNNPTPWTRRMMSEFRGMTRGFCNIDFRRGQLLGAITAVCRFSPLEGQESVRQSLAAHVVPKILDRRGVSSAFLLSSGRMPEMTAEQRIRGCDAQVDWVLMVSGHSAETIAEVASRDLSAANLQTEGAHVEVTRIYRLACLADSATMF